MHQTRATFYGSGRIVQIEIQADVGRGIELDEGTSDLRSSDGVQSSTTVLAQEGEGRHGQKERRRRRGGPHILYSSLLLRQSIRLGSSLAIAV